MRLTIELEHDELTPGSSIAVREAAWTDERILAFSERNPLLRVERDANGDIEIMPPADGETSERNLEFAIDLGNWNRTLPARGKVLDSSGGVILPNGALRSPDATWISPERWAAVPAELRSPFAHVSPDFVFEIMSSNDRLPKAQRKMEEYIANGVAMGWLVDAANRTVYVYRAGQDVQTVLNPRTLSGDPELPGFVADMTRVFA